ncbi:MAG: cellulose synthase [Pseudorhizobium sp.]
MKLPMLMVSAALFAGLFVTQSDDTLLGLPWTPRAGAKDAAPAAPQLLAQDQSDGLNLDGVAQEIQALRQPQLKTERLAPKPPIVPFQLSQLDGTGAAPATGDREDPSQEQPGEVDESALRYFAAQGDTARLAAEIARLRQLYPNWTPPADPLAVPQNGDQQLEAMWQLYAEGRYPEVRKAIAERRSNDAEWQPPADLLDRLEIAEARTRLVNASDLKQYQAVIDIGSSHPPLLNCSEVDVLWRVAEAFAGTDRPQRAADAYSYILTNCADPAERLATMQKALAVLPYERVQPLIALEKPAESGAPEFDSIRDDIARRFMVQANDEPTLEIAPEYVERLKSLASGNGAASDALLLGWYHLRRQKTDEAGTWFRRARDREDSADASQGLALTLLEQGKPAEAEAILYRWRDSSDDAMATYLASTANLLALDPAPVIEDEVLTRMATTVIAGRYAPSAQQFGWYARAFDQPQTAIQWFGTALQWSPKDEPSAYGLALTRQQLNDRNGFLEIQRQWAAESNRIADLAVAPAQLAAERQPATAQGPASPRQARPTAREASAPVQAAPPPSEAVTPVAVATASRATCSSRVDVSRLSPAAALSRGWCLMDLNRPLEAAESFRAAGSSSSRNISEDAAYGQSLAYLRLGLTDQAAVAATKAPMNAQRARQLQASILADRAVQAFQSDRFRETLLYLDQRTQVQQEPVDLMVLRGYSYINLNRPYDALRIFEAAATTGNRDASRGLADAKAAIGLN